MKRLLAGTSAAIALSAAASANAQSGVENTQHLQGAIFAGQKLDVIDPAEGLQASATATGNGVSASTEQGDLDYASSQLANAPVGSRTEVRVHGWSPQTIATSAAVGNAGEASARDGDLSAGARQTVGYIGPITAEAGVVSELSASGDTLVGATALGNTHNFHASNRAGIAAAQETRSGVTAAADAKLINVLGQATVNAAAAANNLTTQGGTSRVSTEQVSGAQGPIKATAKADVENGAVVDAGSSASANNLSAVHDAPYLALDAAQDNGADVEARTGVFVGEFGGVSASADAVGNSIYAGVFGSELELDTEQTNYGSVSAVATFEGYNGYDADLTATAVGNAVTGFACSECDPTLTAFNNQLNQGGVSATTNTRIYGGDRAGRVVNSTASAIGNNAVYHVSRPN